MRHMELYFRQLGYLTSNFFKIKFKASKKINLINFFAFKYVIHHDSQLNAFRYRNNIHHLI